MMEAMDSKHFYGGYKIRMTRYRCMRRNIGRRVSIMNNRKPPKGRLRFAGAFGRRIQHCTIEFPKLPDGAFKATHAYDRVYLSRRPGKVITEAFIAHISDEVEKFQ